MIVMLMYLLMFFFSGVEANSLSSHLDSYIESVKGCAEDESRFENFRRNEPTIGFVYEGIGIPTSILFGESILEKHPYLLEYTNEFAINDTVGNPRTRSYNGLGTFAPLTVRMIHTLGELKDMFDLPKGCDLVEIGCGYGGLCSIVSRVIDFNSYELIDLDCVLPLIDKYLSRVKVRGYSTESNITCGNRPHYDLCISEYGISECFKLNQDEYIEKVLKHSKRGYIVYNTIQGNSNMYTVDEFCERLRESGIDPKVRLESVKSHHKIVNKLIYWGEK